MPSIKRISKRHRRDWNESHLRQLRTGIDFVGDAWGDVAHWPRDDRENWPGEAALEDMQACWEQHGDELVEAEHNRNGLDAMPLWFELVADGMNPHEARQLHRERSYDRAGR